MGSQDHRTRPLLLPPDELNDEIEEEDKPCTYQDFKDDIKETGISPAEGSGFEAILTTRAIDARLLLVLKNEKGVERPRMIRK
jgi:hypothetical protein